MNQLATPLFILLDKPRVTEETESDNDLQTAKKMLECSDKLHVLEGQRIVLSPKINLYALLINTLE